MNILSAQTAFDRTSATYDAARARLIPPYERFYGTAVELLPFDPAAEIRVLDLGAGTGLLSAFVRERFPNARLTLVDVAESMLERARQRLGNHGVEYAVYDYGRRAIEGDRCCSVDEQLAWIREAGFADADCCRRKGALQ